jgi:hypothetical protein
LVGFTTYLRLEPPLKKIFNLQAQDVIELHPAFVQHANSNQATKKRVTFEQATLILLVESEQFTGGLADLREGVPDAPHFALVTKTVLSD